MTNEERKLATPEELKAEKEEMRKLFDNRSLVDLQQSCVQQLTMATGEVLDWDVFNHDGIKIHSLDKDYSEKQIFELQKYAKKFELIAFNIGMQEMKKEKNEEIAKIREAYDATIADMRVENDKVVNKLNELIGLSVEDDEDESSKIGIPEHMR